MAGCACDPGDASEREPNVAVIPIRSEIAGHSLRRQPLALAPFVEAAAKICRDLDEQWAAWRAA